MTPGLGNKVCDICGEGFEDNPGRYCAIGKPSQPEMGPQLGDARHFSCHRDTFNWKPAPTWKELEESFAAIRASMAKLTGPGGAVDKLKDAIGREARNVASDRTLGPPCSMCGAARFEHPTIDCRTWLPPGVD